MYGVFSDDGKANYLHSVFDQPNEALVQMVRYIFFYNYGDVPYGALHAIAETVERTLEEQSRDSIAVKVNQVDWYTEKLTEEFLRDYGHE